MQAPETQLVEPSKPRRRPGRPRAGEPQGEDLREVIIAAAEQVYGAHGFRGASVELIAQAAGISRPLFYRLFKDRRDVIDIVVVRANDALRAAVLTAIIPQTRLLPMLSVAIDAYFDWCRAHSAVAGSICAEQHDPESPASAQREQVIQDLVRLFSSKAQERGSQMVPLLMLDTLICAIEHVGRLSFWPQALPEAELAQNRAIIERIVLAAVATVDEQKDVPGIETLRVDDATL